ncbi:hypothetical protein CYMTET_44719, partial [Cymbomonas tetramitiformis]
MSAARYGKSFKLSQLAKQRVHTHLQLDEETDDVRVARERYESAKDAIYSKGRHRKWAKAIRQHQLGGDYFNDGTDVSKLAKVIVAIKSEISTAGLDCDVFDLDHPTHAVGVPGDEKSDRDGILGRLLAKLEKIENFIKTQKLGGAPAVLPKRNREGLDGFRVGPVDECTMEKLHTLAMCQVFQAAADGGAAAFAAAVEQH